MIALVEFYMILYIWLTKNNASKQKPQYLDSVFENTVDLAANS